MKVTGLIARLGFTTDALTGVFGRTGAAVPKAAPMEMAKALVANGYIVREKTQTVHDPAYLEFIKAVSNSLKEGDHTQAVEALRFLINSGSERAQVFRAGQFAERLGDHYFHGKLYLPGVVEHAVAYAHGRDDALSNMASQIQHGNDRDSNGLAMAIEKVKELDGWHEAKRIAVLNDYPLTAEVIDDLAQLWKANEEQIQQVLQGDLNLVLAYRLDKDGQRAKAEPLFHQGVKAGPTPRLAGNQQLEELAAGFAHPHLLR